MPKFNRKLIFLSACDIFCCKVRSEHYAANTEALEATSPRSHRKSAIYALVAALRWYWRRNEAICGVEVKLRRLLWHAHESSLSAKWLKAENKLSSASLCASGNDEEFHFRKGIKNVSFLPFRFYSASTTIMIFGKALTTFQLAMRLRSSFKVERFDSARLIGFVRLKIHIARYFFKEWILTKRSRMVIFDVFRTCCAFLLSSVYRKLVSKKTERLKGQIHVHKTSLYPLFHNSLISRMKNEAENGNVHDNCCHGCCCWPGRPREASPWRLNSNEHAKQKKKLNGLNRWMNDSVRSGGHRPAEAKSSSNSCAIKYFSLLFFVFDMYRYGCRRWSSKFHVLPRNCCFGLFFIIVIKRLTRNERTVRADGSLSCFSYAYQIRMPYVRSMTGGIVVDCRLEKFLFFCFGSSKKLFRQNLMTKTNLKLTRNCDVNQKLFRVSFFCLLVQHFGLVIIIDFWDFRLCNKFKDMTIILTIRGLASSKNPCKKLSCKEEFTMVWCVDKMKDAEMSKIQNCKSRKYLQI